MNIDFERSGGFAGMVMTTTVNTAELAAPDAQRAQLLVEAADFFRLPATSSTGNQPDRFQYKISVDDGDRHHTITVGESAVPGTLRPLLDWLMDLARQGR